MYLNHVFPRHKTDCGICAVATISNSSYESSLRAILPNRKKHASYGVSAKEISKGLLKLKFNVNEVSVLDKSKNAILVVKVTYRGYKRGWDYHAVVWDAKRQKVLDCQKPFSFISLNEYKDIVQVFEVTPL